MKEVINRQRAFDSSHGWDWRNLPIDQQIAKVQYITVALAGEVGEIANPLKKFMRDSERNGIDLTKYDALKTQLREELIDVFIYIMKLADVIGVDMEEAYYEKVARNEQKHSSFAVSASTKYDKLVRDRIPEIIALDGASATCRTASDSEFPQYLHKKLTEEAQECAKEPSAKELADLLEVIRTVAAHHSIDMATIEAERLKRLESRGGFSKRIILEETT